MVTIRSSRADGVPLKKSREGRCFFHISQTLFALVFTRDLLEISSIFQRRSKPKLLLELTITGYHSPYCYMPYDSGYRVDIISHSLGKRFETLRKVLKRFGVPKE